MVTVSQPLSADSPSDTAYFSILNRARRKWTSLAASSTVRRAENSLTCSHFPRGIHCGLSRLLLALELCCLRGEMTRVKGNHSSYSSVHRVLDNLLLLFHWCLELLRWVTGFHKDALIHGRLSKLMFFGGRVVEHSYLPFWWHCLTRLNIILFANINVI